MFRYISFQVCMYIIYMCICKSHMLAYNIYIHIHMIILYVQLPILVTYPYVRGTPKQLILRWCLLSFL